VNRSDLARSDRLQPRGRDLASDRARPCDRRRRWLPSASSGRHLRL